MDFQSPTLRSASSDLSIAISPLGLIELADEEFEIHGPRLNRYAANWAFYLGHHWSFKRPTGEPQLTFNFCRAIADFLVDFQFGKGIRIRTPEALEAIAPQRYKRVWERDNDMHTFLNEVGQLGAVSGDVFIKVAYEEPYEDAIGRVHPGKVRLLPLNPAFCFPEFHPHDRTRLIRFKLKYRFWGCVDTETEALTRTGWRRYDELAVGDEILALDPETDEIRWKPIEALEIHDYPGHLVRWSSRIDAVTTPNHRWLVERQRGRAHTLRYEREIARTEFSLEGDPAIKDLRQGSRVVVGGGTPLAFADSPKWADELVETVAWYITEGNDHVNQNGFRSMRVAQSATRNPDHLARLRRLSAWWSAEGGTFSEGKQKPSGVVEFYLGKGVVDAIDTAAPDKRITPEFLCSLTYSQAVMFYNTLMDGDGCRTHGTKKSERWTQLDDGRKDSFQMLCAMLGKRSAITGCGEKVQVYANRYIASNTVEDTAQRVYTEDGKIWCPVVEGGIWFARRNGSTYWTGNTSLEGTRQVFTYVELLTDEVIEEYVNDELIDSRPNPLGMIPIVPIANLKVASSPWGLADIQELLNLNREFNEKATQLSDIINYHSEPVTVITGAKASNLEKGPNKVWSGLPKDARIENLQSGADINGILAFMELLKRTMHEISGVPETALGQEQPVSNTSGVALSIMYLPLMFRYGRKMANYSQGFKKVNELIMLTLAVKEPEALLYNPADGVPLQQDNLPQLDPNDPLTYQTEIYWPPPLPMDVMAKLQEITAKMQLGIESKIGALRELGEEQPEVKMGEIFEEQVEDLKNDGALQIMSSQIALMSTILSGGVPPAEPAGPSSGGDSTGGAGQPNMLEALAGSDPAILGAQMDVQAQLFKELVARTFGETPNRAPAEN